MSPRIGDFGVVATGGTAARLIRWGTDSPVNHAFVYVGAGRIVEAEPDGAAVASASKYGDRPVWSDGVELGLNTTARLKIAHAALTLVGTPYSWLDIVAITLAQPRLGSHEHVAAWISRHSSGLICSQLVDVAYQRAGVVLFDDGRLPGLVSPGDLYDLIDAAVTA